MTAPQHRADQVVLLITDTTRWDMLGCYRDTGIRTPYLDGLAAGGLRVDRAYTCTPVCGPARSALLTGTWPHANGALANSMAFGANFHTLGQRLSDHGIATGYIGKWHLDGTDYFGNGQCPDGWDPDYWYDGRRYLDELTTEERVRSRAMDSNGRVDENFTYAHRCSTRAIDFIERHRDERFFLVVSYDEPHGPSISPEPYASAYAEYDFPKSPNVWDTLKDKPDHQQVWAGERMSADRDAVRINKPAYFGSQSYVDAEIGRVLETIDDAASGALVCYTSDHGDALESHCLTGKGPAFYDEVARIPLLIRWPGVTTPGSVCAQPGSHIDVAPTVLDAMGLPVPPSLDGTSMVPMLVDPTRRVNDCVFTEFHRFEIDHDGFGGLQLLRGVLGGHHKLVVNLLSGDELYDLDADPGEMTNLIDDPRHASIRDGLHDRLLSWMDDTRDPFRGYYWQHRPWRTGVPAPSWSGNGMTRQPDDDGYQPRMLDYDTGLPITETVRPKQ